MSLCMALEKALSKSVSLTAVVVGHGFGFDLMKTLHFARALATLNSISRPNLSCCRDCVAVVYSASGLCLWDLFPCLKLLKDTAGP